MIKKILSLFIVTMSLTVNAGKPGSESSVPTTIKFAGYSTVTVTAGSTLVEKNDACREAFPNSVPLARMASTNELIAAMDDGTFTIPSGNALLRPGPGEILGNPYYGVVFVDSLVGIKDVGICNGSYPNHLIFNVSSNKFSITSCNLTNQYIVACSTAQ